MSTQTTQASQPLLSVRDVTTTFTTPRGALTAVNGVSFDLHAGKILGVVGESGSGKSVLARTVMGLLPSNAQVTSGQVLIGGTDITDRSLRQRRALWGSEIAMVFQNPMTSLNPVVPISRQLTEGMRLRLGLSRRHARTRALELLNLVGIPEPRKRFDAYPHELSGGMRQRVAIAVALSAEPRLLLADEPTTALDVTIQRHILDLLRELCREASLGLVLITHDMGVVAQRADTVAVMYAGRIVESASTRQIFAEPHHPYTRGLLRSIPRLDMPAGTKLSAIPGRPPNLLDLPTGCAFASRCGEALASCSEEQPGISRPREGHYHRCVLPAPGGIAATSHPATTAQVDLEEHRGW